MLHAKKTLCPICGTSFLGRRDKKFCSDNCRAISHQAEKQKQAPIIKQINTILKKNRDLLIKHKGILKSTWAIYIRGNHYYYFDVSEKFIFDKQHRYKENELFNEFKNGIYTIDEEIL